MVAANRGFDGDRRHDITPLRVEKYVKQVVEAVVEGNREVSMNIVGSAEPIELKKDMYINLAFKDHRKDKSPQRVIVDTTVKQVDVGGGGKENRVRLLVDNLEKPNKEEINMTDEGAGEIWGEVAMVDDVGTWRVVELGPGVYVIGRAYGKGTDRLVNMQPNGWIGLPVDKESKISKQSLALEVTGEGKIYMLDISENHVCFVDDRGVVGREHLLTKPDTKS